MYRMYRMMQMRTVKLINDKREFVQGKAFFLWWQVLLCQYSIPHRCRQQVHVSVCLCVCVCVCVYLCVRAHVCVCACVRSVSKT